jgi:hypothetical protein
MRFRWCGARVANSNESLDVWVDGNPPKDADLVVSVRVLLRNGNTETWLYGIMVRHWLWLEVPFWHLVNPYASRATHAQGNGGEIGVWRDGRHSLVQKLGARPSLLVRQEHFSLGEALAADVVNAPGVFIRVEGKQLVHMAGRCVRDEGGLASDACGLGEENGARPDSLGRQRDWHTLLIQRAIVQTWEHKHGGAGRLARIACDQQRASVVGKLQRVADWAGERPSTRLGCVRADGHQLDAKLVPDNQDASVRGHDHGVGLVHQHDGAPLLDLAVPLAVDLIQVHLRGARQHGQQEAVLLDVDGNGLALHLQRPGPQARQLAGLDQPDVGGRVHGDKGALARDVEAEAIGQGRRRGRVGRELEHRDRRRRMQRGRGTRGTRGARCAGPVVVLVVLVRHGRGAARRGGRDPRDARGQRVGGRRGRQVRGRSLIRSCRERVQRCAVRQTLRPFHVGPDGQLTAAVSLHVHVGVGLFPPPDSHGAPVGRCAVPSRVRSSPWMIEAGRGSFGPGAGSGYTAGHGACLSEGQWSSQAMSKGLWATARWTSRCTVVVCQTCLSSFMHDESLCIIPVRPANP